MAEGGVDVNTDVNETLSSCAEMPQSVTNVLAMTVDELRTELWIRGVSFVGGTKPELQTLLLEGLGQVGASMQHLEIPTEWETVTEVQVPVMYKQPLLADESVTVPPGPSVPDYSLLPRAKSPPLPKDSSNSSDAVRALELQLQLRKLRD